MNQAVLEIHNEQDFDDKVLHERQPVAVEFEAPWSSDSARLQDTLAALAEEFDGQVKVAAVNVEELPELSRQWEVQDVPTVIVFHGGRAVKKWLDPQDLHEYRQTFQSRLRQMDRHTTPMQEDQP